MGKQVSPRVFKIAETKLNDEEVVEWLQYIHGEECLQHIHGEDKEKLIELAGRRCYRSYSVGQNPNITRVRTNSSEYHENVLKSGHGSILEHGNVTFAFENVSRVFTHELVRHRAGTAFSQESLRYVRLTDIDTMLPDIFNEFGDEKKQKAQELFSRAIETMEGYQKELSSIFSEELQSSFEVKKSLTSAFRRIAPIGLATGIIVTFNFRSLRHIITLRTSRHAEQELRFVFNQVANICMNNYPLIFGDFTKIDTKDGLFEYITPYIKV